MYSLRMWLLMPYASAIDKPTIIKEAIKLRKIGYRTGRLFRNYLKDYKQRVWTFRYW